ncbi:MAG: aspartate carbamoyltransferase catalytic subunit [Gammaproteobacteria bacterium]
MFSATPDRTARLRHLVTLADLPRAKLVELLDSAEEFRLPAGAPLRCYDLLDGKTIALLFFEPSTRTRSSFELAARRLGASVLGLNLAFSSTLKGESEVDTLYTLEAMHVDGFVVRHKQPGVPQNLVKHAAAASHIISAGEAHLSHPTQGLLDAFTIRRHKPGFAGLSVTIAGDIRHSRVARSAVQALATLGTRDIRYAGPAELLPEDLAGEKFTNLDKALTGADVIMMLRIQKERMQAGLIPDEHEYFQRYGLTPARLALAKPDAIVMHPGPMNRGVEIASAVADGPQSVIREQVGNGVAVRMAALAEIFGK